MNRRGFFKRLAAVGAGCLVAAAPIKIENPVSKAVESTTDSEGGGKTILHRMHLAFRTNYASSGNTASMVLVGWDGKQFVPVKTTSCDNFYG